jgi:hypothetical protein
VASDTLNQAILGLANVLSYLKAKGASSQTARMMNTAMSNLKSALNVVMSTGNVTAAEVALNAA